MRINRGQVAVMIFFSASIFMVGFALFRRHQLEHNYKIVIGRVTWLTGSKHGDYSLIYTYEVDHKKYSRDVDMNLCGAVKIRDVRQFTVNRSFPIAYDTLAPGVSTILLSLSAAERFKYKMPDSLYPCLRHIDCDYYDNVTPEDYGK